MTLNAYQLKWIALITMTIDHIGYFIFPDQLWIRMIGRIAFPIFAFLVANSYRYTKNKKRYALTMLGFALAVLFIPSIWGYELPANIFFTLFFGFMSIYALDKKQPWHFIWIILGVILSNPDYGWYGVFLIPLFYYTKKEFLWIFFILYNIILINIQPLSWVQYFSIMALPFIYSYNNQKGKSMKYFFYFYYPIHMAVLYYIGLQIHY